MAITTKHDGISLNSNLVWIENHAFEFEKSIINKGPRIGIDYAEEHADLPYRFWVNPKSATQLWNA